jgi:hypothetical protein
MRRNKSSNDFGMFESKVLVIYQLTSSALTGLGCWKAWELASWAWRWLF